MGANSLHDTGNMGISEFRHMAQRSRTIVILVTLDVGFIFEIYTIFVACVEPVWVIGIVGSAHVVDVASAHEHDLVDHLLVSDGVARCEVDLLTVNALQLHRHVVDVIVAACQSELIVLGLGVAYLHLSHAEISREGLDHLAFLVEQLAHKHIAVRSLAAPQLGRHVDVESCISCFAYSHLYLFCLCLQRFARYLVRPQLALLDSICDGQVFCLLFGEVVEISLYLDGCLVRIVDARCAHDDILDLHLALGIQIDRAIDTRQAPHVLSLQETAIAVAIHLHSECVAALWVEVRSDVEACGVARIL